MNPTNIEYLTHTWNPLAMRCTPVSEGCAHCWHLSLCNRLSANPKLSTVRRNAYAGLVGPQLLQDELDAPLKRKKPSIIGVQFMGDLFHEDVEYHQINEIFGMMYKCDHTFLILTKRPQRMYEFLKHHIYMGGYWFDIDPKYHSHIWLGVSAENQQTADERISILMQIPAAKRFVSIEPMLGPVEEFYEYFQWEQLHWVIVGGLSLPGGKIQPPKREWLDSIVEQCSDAGVPIFLKDNAQYPIERTEFPNA